jgi:aspartate-semialdehyde dehydrogenase
MAKLACIPMVISAHTNRVAVVDAHTICLSFSTNQKVSKDNIISVLKNYQMPEICIGYCHPALIEELFITKRITVRSLDWTGIWAEECKVNQCWKDSRGFNL